ncbi:hypothetical protein AGMMS50268_12850 [Spirochaetia bacterium]|nr:hypothetical protein AGMMS50268_12850 [Spirochaetia bacterium]
MNFLFSIYLIEIKKNIIDFEFRNVFVVIIIPENKINIKKPMQIFSGI